MNDDVKKTIETAPTAKGGSAETTRWTRPAIHELGRVQRTESGTTVTEEENSGCNE